MALRSVILFLLVTAGTPWAASAADIVLDGEAACLSIGGGWSAATCTVASLIVPVGTRLFTRSGVTLATGELLVDGLLQLDGGFEPTRTLVNRGTLITRSFIVNQAKMSNQGTWLNQGTFYSDNTVVNEWIFDNRGLFQTRSGAFVNRGYTVIVPGSQIWNSGGLMVNEGNVYNYGYLQNPAGSTIDNGGLIVTYDATFFNSGRTIGRCGSAYRGDQFGYPIGNPIEFEPCSGADAATVLANYVLALGNRQVLPKDDTILLSRLAAKAAKRLQGGDRAGAVELLQAFLAEVSGRVGYPLRELLLARGSRALELTASP